MQTVTYADACENLNALIDKVVVDRAPLTVICEGGKAVVLISDSKWASIEETFYSLQSATSVERLLDATGRFERGDEGIPLP